MKRSFLLQTALLTVVIVWSGALRAEDAPFQRDDIGFARELYDWLIDHDEFSAAGKLAAELQAMHPDDPNVQAIVVNAQLQTAFRQAGHEFASDAPVDSAAPNDDWESLLDDVGWVTYMDVRESAPVGPDLLKEARLRRSLSEPISLHFDKAPLSEVMRHISDVHAVNIVIDTIGLQEEGVTPDVPMTINVDGIVLKSALNLILMPLNLDHRIEDEVIKISSYTKLIGPYLTRVYAVPDLLTPIRHFTPETGESRQPSTAEFESLSKLITATIDPDGWEEFGGRGQIQQHDATISLIVYQTERVHEVISDLLMQLRDRQVTHTMHLISMPGVAGLSELGLSVNETVRILTAEEQSELESTIRARESSSIEIFALPPVTLHSGQTGTIRYSRSENPVLITSFVSGDRREVRINVAAPNSLNAGELLAATQSVRLSDGEIALIVLWPGPLDHRSPRFGGMVRRFRVLAITPRIQVHEEELLGLPVF